MSYATQAQLSGDAQFQGRISAANIQQAQVFKDDQRPDFVALAAAVGRGNPDVTMAFVRIDAAGPGIADKATLPDGSIDQSLITDADLLSLTQANWPVVASLYFQEDGSPKP